MFIVAKYNTSREYGGPEEGGWYFTEQAFDKVITAHTYEYQAVRACQSLNAQRNDDPDDGFHYTVVAIPRWDDDPDGDSCHRDPDQVPAAPKLRADVPLSLPEHRPALLLNRSGVALETRTTAPLVQTHQREGRPTCATLLWLTSPKGLSN